MEKQKYKLSPKKYVTYEQRVRIVNTQIGDIKLKDLNTKILENFYFYMRNEYISEKSKKNISNTTL